MITPRWMAIVIVVMGWLATQPGRLEAQSTPTPVQADNSAYVGTGSSQTLGGSVALVDATTYYAQNNSDICETINYIITTAYTEATANGVIVDARGINASPGSTLTCANSPYNNVQNVVSGFNITLLLPASTIAIQKTWLLPTSTRIIGESQGLTVIQACNGTGCSFTTGGGYNGGSDMIDMGKNDGTNFCGLVSGGVYDCTGIGIEHVTLDGNNQSLNGIVNPYSQELTYVKDVGIINISSGGTGLWLANHDAANSGPYSNIYYSGTGACAQIYNVNTAHGSDTRPMPDTRGIHGLTCIGSSTTGAAILLDGSYNSLEDVYISGFTDGILVGSRWAAQGNLIFNVTGGSGVTKLVHISGATTLYSNCPPGTQNQVGNPNNTNVQAQNVCDLTILGVTSAGGNSIYDEITGAHLTDSNVAIYALGEQNTITTGLTAYSRFATSTSIPAWFVGSNPSGDTGCGTGSLYSVTSGSAPHILWGCVQGTWTFVPGT